MGLRSLDLENAKKNAMALIMFRYSKKLLLLELESSKSRQTIL